MCEGRQWKKYIITLQLKDISLLSRHCTICNARPNEVMSKDSLSGIFKLHSETSLPLICSQSTSQMELISTKDTGVNTNSCHPLDVLEVYQCIIRDFTHNPISNYKC